MIDYNRLIRHYVITFFCKRAIPSAIALPAILPRMARCYSKSFPNLIHSGRRWPFPVKIFEPTFRTPPRSIPGACQVHCLSYLQCLSFQILRLSFWAFVHICPIETKRFPAVRPSAFVTVNYSLPHRRLKTCVIAVSFWSRTWRVVL